MPVGRETEGRIQQEIERIKAMWSGRGFWYLATPYTRYPYGMESAFREASKAAALLIQAGIPVFCPIAHSHPIAVHGHLSQTDHGTWLTVDKPMMDAAVGLIVVQMSGYEQSVGVQHERDVFGCAGKRAVFLPWDDSHLASGSVPPDPAPTKPAPAPAGQKQFVTGAVRSDDADGTRYDLISPIGLRRLAETCREGAEKYSDYNWERGMPVGEMLNHGIRHLYQYLAGNRDEDHLAHAAWNCFAAMHSEEMWPDLNRGTLREAGCRPPSEPQPAELAG